MTGNSNEMNSLSIVSVSDHNNEVNENGTVAKEVENGPKNTATDSLRRL